MATDPKILKERALFYLGRKIGELGRPSPDHVKMAESKMSYTDRVAEVDKAEHAQKEVENEREAWHWILKLVTEAEPE